MKCIVTLHYNRKKDTQGMNEMDLVTFVIEGFYFVEDVDILLFMFLETGPLNL